MKTRIMIYGSLLLLFIVSFVYIAQKQQAPTGVATGYKEPAIQEKISYRCKGLIPTSALKYSPVFIEDLDEDGYPEIIFENKGSYVEIWENLSDNTFKEDTVFPDIKGQLMNIGDSDGDGIKEFIFYTKNGIDICKSEYPFDLVTHIPLETPKNITNLGISDLDEDGSPEITAAGHEGIVIIENVGYEEYKEVYRSDFGKDSSSHKFGISDFDNDGNKEIVVTAYNHSNNESYIYVLECIGDNYYKVVYQSQELGKTYGLDNCYWCIECNDFDDDGRGEFAVLGGKGPEGSPTQWKLMIFESTGDNSFKPIWEYRTEGSAIYGGLAVHKNKLLLQIPAGDEKSRNIIFTACGDNKFCQIWSTGERYESSLYGGSVMGIDSDNDSREEIIFITKDGNLYFFEQE